MADLYEPYTDLTLKQMKLLDPERGLVSDWALMERIMRRAFVYRDLLVDADYLRTARREGLEE